MEDETKKKHKAILDKIYSRKITEGESCFEASFRQFAEKVHESNRGKGFYEEEHRGMHAYVKGEAEGDKELEELGTSLVRAKKIEKLALIVTEVTEAIENLRKGGGGDDHLPEFDGDIVEMADVIIRAVDYAAAQGKEEDLARALVMKFRYNKERPHKHGKKC